MELYKKDSNGKIRIYRTYTEGDVLVQETGLLDGKMVENRVVCKAKNVGRANGTTGEQQAILEMNSRLNKKVDEGYFGSIEEAERNQVLLPMLAEEYERVKSKIEFPCYVQPKLDGMRCHLNKEKVMSRTGKEIVTVNHIQEEWSRLPYADTLDGELYSHGLSFQENMKLIKKYREGETESVKLHVYDLTLPNLPFSERYTLLKHMVEKMETISLVETYKVESLEEITVYHQQFLEQGYEGTIIRWGSKGYEFDKRTIHLVKYKDFKDEAFQVIDIIPSDRRPTHGIVVCKIGGHTFNATPKMPHQEREELLTNKEKYIGQTAEVRFFEKTDDGIPRFPVCVGFRLDK